MKRVVRDSFFNGMGSVMDIHQSQKRKYTLSRRFQKRSDKEVLRRDWERVGTILFDVIKSNPPNYVPK